jgi:SpoVK/Ycf46/Vps4 family AAA+-type ATPase
MDTPIFITKVPKIKLDDVLLAETTRLQFEKIINEQESRHLLLTAGLKPKKRLLFHGAAGTGKTLGAEAIAHHLNKHLHIFNLEALSGTNPDEAMHTVTLAFEAINASDDIYLFDEFDAIASARNASGANQTNRRTSNALLIAFEQIHSQAILICATNFITTVDPAFRRRFDTICKFDLPPIDERERILKKTLEKYGMRAPEDDILQAAKASENLSYHETEEIAIAAIKTALLKQTKIAALIPEIPSALERRHTFKSASDYE